MPKTSPILRLSLLLLAAALLAIAIFLPPAGCQSSTTNSGLRTVSMRIGHKTFTLEVADTDATREIGLMQRDSLASGHGMLFIFPDEQPRSFWMKNTRIPLDIIYLNAAGQVVCIRQMRPYSLQSVPSDAPAQYAIELNQGAASSAGVNVGDTLTIPEIASAGPR